ncbi:hypothetical protein LRAMOSA03411 [Lichtheimia ramosa]|uniref:Glutathione S-transferase C-terminal domain-containing protein n=1 Tax=Lichtheimia ramosa TaxID=688394 RepID=A0A077WVX2_9FUNG|nr:hypothetical protein LRAMOSA03411 [Lichtheimia ramosa]
MTSSDKVIFHYVIPGYAALGGPLRFLLDDSGVDYEFDLIPWDDFVSKVKYQWIESGYPFDQAPMIEYKGKRYSGNMPIMRFLSKKFGKYVPADEDVEQFVDCTLDAAMDWNRARFTYVQRGKDGIEEYEKQHLDVFFSRFERVYKYHDGPFAAGQQITYADFYVFFVINLPLHREHIKEYPKLAEFADIMYARQSLQAGIEYMKTMPNPKDD